MSTDKTLLLDTVRRNGIAFHVDIVGLHHWHSAFRTPVADRPKIDALLEQRLTYEAVDATPAAVAYDLIYDASLLAGHVEAPDPDAHLGWHPDWQRCYWNNFGADVVKLLRAVKDWALLHLGGPLSLGWSMGGSL